VWWQRPELKIWVVGVQQPREIEEVEGGGGGSETDDDERQW
jgi:hypothetical protein